MGSSSARARASADQHRPATKQAAGQTGQADRLSLWDWRRVVAELYGRVRAAPNPEAGWAGWRRGRDELFGTHPQTPLSAEARHGFAGLPVFSYDPGLRFALPTKAVRGEPATLDAGQDGLVTITPFARTDGLAGPLGAELTLYWIGGYGGGVFLPFRDGTSGRDSFGGGRYLLDTIKGADLGRTADGWVILDFNFAYNPSCAYSDAWLCPLPPPENTLPEAVPAGEKAPGKWAEGLSAPR